MSLATLIAARIMSRLEIAGGAALNPDELVSNDLKIHRTGGKLITSLAQLRQMIISYMRQLQKLPALVRRFLHAPTPRYACA